MRRRIGPLLTIFLAVALLCPAILAGVPQTTAGHAQESAAQLPKISPEELVNRVVQNELQAGKNNQIRWMYKDWRKTPSGSKTKMMIETDQGTVAYLLDINGKPLTPQERHEENQRLENFLNNRQEQSRKKKAQQEDSNRVTRLFKQLPNAFLYQYAGVERGKDGRELVKLTFKPNPKYDPPSRETSVFKAMDGTMLIDPKAERLASIQATLFDSVNFGWGILGHLDKGGHFFVEQSEVAPGDWEPTYMNIQFTGKILLFKTIDLRQVEETSDYVRVPDNLNLAQGVEMLKKHASAVLAENSRAEHK